jgi:Sulfotransferase family
MARPYPDRGCAKPLAGRERSPQDLTAWKNGRAGELFGYERACWRSHERWRPAGAPEPLMAIKPIFIFSISRSGSTLIQRIVAAHEGVATVSEPWLLLPYAYTLRERGVDAEYFHPLMVAAIEDFCSELPGGSEDYLTELRRFVLRLYERAAHDGARYFLDKSPPYCLIASEILRLFPEGRFVFLWRSPLSVLASIADTWGPWRPTLLSNDLFVGLPRLVAAYEANRARAHGVRFEDLLSGEGDHWRSMMDYLGIEFEPDSLHTFSDVELNGRMGDPTGRKLYSTLNAEPEQKWRSTLGNPLRREWCRRYLRFLGEERLGVMGYDKRQLIGELDSQPASASRLIPDLGRLAADIAKEPIRMPVRRRGVGGPSVLRALLGA